MQEARLAEKKNPSVASCHRRVFVHLALPLALTVPSLCICFLFFTLLENKACASISLLIIEAASVLRIVLYSVRRDFRTDEPLLDIRHLPRVGKDAKS